MKYLLDVNALVALGFTPSRVPQPDSSVDTGREVSAFGYLLDYRAGVRESLGTSSGYGFSVAQARTLLLRLKKAPSLAHPICHCQRLSEPRDSRTPSSPGYHIEDSSLS